MNPQLLPFPSVRPYRHNDAGHGIVCNCYILSPCRFNPQDPGQVSKSVYPWLTYV
jgi:hypothetical protein